MQNNNSDCSSFIDIEVLVAKTNDHEARIRVLENDAAFFKDQIKEIRTEVEDIKKNVTSYQQIIDQKLNDIFSRLVEHIAQDSSNLKRIFVSSILEFLAVFGSLLFILLEVVKK